MRPASGQGPNLLGGGLLTTSPGRLHGPSTRVHSPTAASPPHSPLTALRALAPFSGSALPPRHQAVPGERGTVEDGGRSEWFEDLFGLGGGRGGDVGVTNG
jgi:hypothetical protein